MLGMNEAAVLLSKLWQLRNVKYPALSDFRKIYPTVSENVFTHGVNYGAADFAATFSRFIEEEYWRLQPDAERARCYVSRDVSTCGGPVHSILQSVPKVLVRCPEEGGEIRTTSCFFVCFFILLEMLRLSCWCLCVFVEVLSVAQNVLLVTVRRWLRTSLYPVGKRPLDTRRCGAVVVERDGARHLYAWSSAGAEGAQSVQSRWSEGSSCGLQPRRWRRPRMQTHVPAYRDAVRHCQTLPGRGVRGSRELGDVCLSS